MAMLATLADLSDRLLARSLSDLFGPAYGYYLAEDAVETATSSADEAEETESIPDQDVAMEEEDEKVRDQRGARNWLDERACGGTEMDSGAPGGHNGNCGSLDAHEGSAVYLRGRLHHNQLETDGLNNNVLDREMEVKSIDNFRHNRGLTLPVLANHGHVTGNAPSRTRLLSPGHLSGGVDSSSYPAPSSSPCLYHEIDNYTSFIFDQPDNSTSSPRDSRPSSLCLCDDTDDTVACLYDDVNCRKLCLAHVHVRNVSCEECDQPLPPPPRLDSCDGCRYQELPEMGLCLDNEDEGSDCDFFDGPEHDVLSDYIEYHYGALTSVDSDSDVEECSSSVLGELWDSAICLFEDDGVHWDGCLARDIPQWDECQAQDSPQWNECLAQDSPQWNECLAQDSPQWDECLAQESPQWGQLVSRGDASGDKESLPDDDRPDQNDALLLCVYSDDYVKYIRTFNGCQFEQVNILSWAPAWQNPVWDLA